MIIKTGKGCPKELLSGPFQASAFNGDPNMSIWVKYFEFKMV